MKAGAEILNRHPDTNILIESLYPARRNASSGLKESIP